MQRDTPVPNEAMLYVSDVRRSLRFYCELLSLVAPNQWAHFFQ
jgi:catechol 2,3-dioxygenase-like lactoylglutathione lyase family enzyme